MRVYTVPHVRVYVHVHVCVSLVECCEFASLMSVYSIHVSCTVCSFCFCKLQEMSIVESCLAYCAVWRIEPPSLMIFIMCQCYSLCVNAIHIHMLTDTTCWHVYVSANLIRYKN